MRIVLARAALACALVFWALPSAQAATVHYSISFSAFMIPGTPNPLTGSFELQLDPTLTYVDSTTGITLTSLNAPLDSALAFSYTPALGGSLVVGGLQSGAAFISPFPFTNDFLLTIGFLNTGPIGLVVAQSVNLFEGIFGIHNVGVVTSLSVSEVTAVPLPGAILLFGSALAGFFGFSRLRERFRARAAAAA